MITRTPEKRTANLLAFFGWQGGTIHQLAAETGVDVRTLLYADSAYTDRFAQGCCALETCGLAYRLKLAQRTHGDVAFWLGVAHAVDVCREVQP